MTKTVAIQGIQGSFHEIAARGFFREEKIELTPCVTFERLFDLVRKNPDYFGVAAIENTLAGSLLPNYRLIQESGLKIIGEYLLRIKHNLVALPGQKLSDIKEVHSHPMAIMQCEVFFSQFPQIKLVTSEDTALSAKVIADEKIEGRGAIVSEMAAEIFGLDILEKGIETHKKNFTRFLILANSFSEYYPVPESVINKSSLLFTLAHEEGSLAKVLSMFNNYHINLTKIQSMPIIGREWEYMFYVDMIFDNYGRYRESLEAIRPLIKNLKILGEYQDAKTLYQNGHKTSLQNTER